LSFPCIQIPNEIAAEFVEWFHENEDRYKKDIENGKNDDGIFRDFMNVRHCGEGVFNVSPNIVDHIDYLIGGTVINGQRKKKQIRSVYWTEENLVDDLSERLKNEDCYTKQEYID